MESLSSNPELRQIAENAAAASEINSEEAFEKIVESVNERKRFMRLSHLGFLTVVCLIIQADHMGLEGDERRQWMMDQILREDADKQT